jgi:translation initiation factor IF-2
MDALEDRQQSGALPSVELARSGVGEVSIHDVMVAQAASGIILAYGVSVDKEALRQITV